MDASRRTVGGRQVAGALPRSVQRHSHVPTKIQTAAFTLEAFGATGESCAMTTEDFPPSIYKTSNSTYGSPASRGVVTMQTIGSPTSRRSGLLDPSAFGDGSTVARPITGREPVQLAPSGYPPPSSLPSFYSDGTGTQHRNALPAYTFARGTRAGVGTAPAGRMGGADGTLSWSDGAPKTSTDANGFSSLGGSKRYPRPKKMTWEKNFEAAVDGFAVPTKCNGYGQGLSKRVVDAVFSITDGTPEEAPAVNKPMGTNTLRSSRRINQAVESYNPVQSVEHATYGRPGFKHLTNTYTGTKTGYVSGFARNQPLWSFKLPPEAQTGPTLEDIHPSVVPRFKTKDPVQFANLLESSIWRSTYKQTLGVSADSIIERTRLS